MVDWPHGPIHRLDHSGAFMVTAGTYEKSHFFQTPDRLNVLHDLLLELADQTQWRLQAWAVFSNHYHFVAISPADPESLKAMIQQLHYDSAVVINGLDGTPGRKVWFQYWDKHLTFQHSYLARLNYVLQNPVRHRMAARSSDYRWCSAGWFERTGTPAFVKSVASFKIDKLDVPDDF